MAVCKGVGPFSIAWQAIILTDERTDQNGGGSRTLTDNFQLAELTL